MTYDKRRGGIEIGVTKEKDLYEIKKGPEVIAIGGFWPLSGQLRRATLNTVKPPGALDQ